MRPDIRSFALLFTFALFSFPGTSSAQELFSLDLAADFASGDYGTGQTTDSYSTSVVLGYYPTDRLDFGLAATYLYQSSRATTSAGGIFFGRAEAGMVPESTGPGDQPGMTAPAPIVTTEEVDESRSGLGDLLASAGFEVFPEKENRPKVRVTGYVKIPTADEDNGLGTGEYDYSLGLELSKWIDQWLLHGGGTVVFQGENDLLQLEDFSTYEIGLGYLLRSDLLADLSFWGATEPAEGAGSLAEARLEFTKWNQAGTGLTFYVAAGLVENSMDFGAGGAYFFTF